MITLEGECILTPDYTEDLDISEVKEFLGKKQNKKYMLLSINRENKLVVNNIGIPIILYSFEETNSNRIYESKNHNLYYLIDQFVKKTISEEFFYSQLKIEVIRSFEDSYLISNYNLLSSKSNLEMKSYMYLYDWYGEEFLNDIDLFNLTMNNTIIEHINSFMLNRELYEGDYVLHFINDMTKQLLNDINKSTKIEFSVLEIIKKREEMLIEFKPQFKLYNTKYMKILNEFNGDDVDIANSIFDSIIDTDLKIVQCLFEPHYLIMLFSENYNQHSLIPNFKEALLKLNKWESFNYQLMYRYNDLTVSDKYIPLVNIINSK